MIYNPNYTSRVELFGEEADNFLEESGVILYEDCVVLEGQQAEEYLKRKKAEKDAEEEKYAAKYQDKNGNPEGGRSANVVRGGYDIAKNSYHVTTPNDPKHKTAREIENHHKKYGDVMPGKTKSEKDLDKARRSEEDSRRYASAMLDKKRDEYYANRDISKGDRLAYNAIVDTQAAHDAARRHYRRTHKNESGIFADVDLME